MIIYLKRLIWLLLIAASAISFVFCQQISDPGPSSLERISENGRVVMITQNAQNTYYIYREQPFGFEYELASKFARFLGVDLAVVTPDRTEMFDLLQKGRGDFIAAGVSIHPTRDKWVEFSDPYMTVRHEVIVHHDEKEVMDIGDLNGMAVHVAGSTSYHERIAELIGNETDINLVPVPEATFEELIERVAEYKIDATVTFSNIARLNKLYEPDIRIAFPISQPLPVAWAVRRDDLELLDAINRFFYGIRNDGTFDEIYNRYYKARKHLDSSDLRIFHKIIEERMPLYRPLIKDSAKNHGFDWRLITAMIYQESLFDPAARSYTGVKGLMQVTQRTAEEMGITDREDPEQSIRAGVMYLARLHDRFSDIENENNRLYFSLASYNVGYGHVRDAQKILSDRGRDSESWETLRETLPLLRLPEFYKNTRFGYARGKEPVRYVDNVLTYYEVLKRKI